MRGRLPRRFGQCMGGVKGSGSSPKRGYSAMPYPYNTPWHDQHGGLADLEWRKPAMEVPGGSIGTDGRG